MKATILGIDSGEATSVVIATAEVAKQSLLDTNMHSDGCIIRTEIAGPPGDNNDQGTTGVGPCNCD